MGVIFDVLLRGKTCAFVIVDSRFVSRRYKIWLENMVISVVFNGNGKMNGGWRSGVVMGRSVRVLYVSRHAKSIRWRGLGFAIDAGNGEFLDAWESRLL